MSDTFWNGVVFGIILSTLAHEAGMWWRERKARHGLDNDNELD